MKSAALGSVDKRRIHLQDASYVTQKYGKESEAVFLLSRVILNRKIIVLAKRAGGDFFN
jgi:kynurenine 3-monooxygenase